MTLFEFHAWFIYKHPVNSLNMYVTKIDYNKNLRGLHTKINNLVENAEIWFICLNSWKFFSYLAAYNWLRYTEENCPSNIISCSQTSLPVQLVEEKLSIELQLSAVSWEKETLFSTYYTNAI